MKFTTLAVACLAFAISGFVCCSCGSGGDANVSAPKLGGKDANLAKSTNQAKSGGGNLAPDTAMAAPPGVKTGTP